MGLMGSSFAHSLYPSGFTCSYLASAHGRGFARHSKPTTGGRTLEELVPGLPRKIAKFLSWKDADDREHRRYYERSDLGNAEKFVDMHGNRVRWCPALKSWLFYDGRRWARDERGEVVKLAHLTARSRLQDAAAEEDPAKQKEIAKFAISSQNEGRIRAHFKTASRGAWADQNTPEMREYLPRSAHLYSRPACLQQGFEMHS